MNITDVIIDGYWKVESVGKERIIAKTCCGNKNGKCVYLKTYKILQDILKHRIICHEAVERARSSGRLYFDCGQDVTKWFGIQIVQKRMDKIDQEYWNLINPIIKEW